MSEQHNSLHSCLDDISTTYASVHNIFEEGNSNTTIEWKKNLLDIIQITYSDKKYWPPIYFLILVNADGTQHLMIYDEITEIHQTLCEHLL